MEIKLSAGDKIQVPAGCKATIKENTIVIEKREQEFKDGDILHSTASSRVVIFKCYTDEAKGLHWNAETKEMEKIRKRAKQGKKYLYINEAGIIHNYIEDYDIFDNKAYNLGNYYLLSEREEAEDDAKAIRAIFEKRKKVIQD